MSESRFDFFIFTVAVCVCIAYAGYVVGIARALNGHLHLAMPGLLLPTGLAIVYSTAGVLLGADLVISLQCIHVAIFESLPKYVSLTDVSAPTLMFWLWHRRPGSREIPAVLHEVTCTSVSGCYNSPC